MIWLWLSAAFMAATAGVHSLLGYQRLLVSLLRVGPDSPVDPLTRRIVLFAWHATSVLMVISAAAVAWPGTPQGLLIAIGSVWLATGLFDAAYTRGRHIAWPAITGAGICALAGAFA